MHCKFVITLLLSSVSLINIVQSFPTIFSWYKDFQQCVITPNICPNNNITFYLYTRQTRENPIEIHAQNIEQIYQLEFIYNVPIIILIHGYSGHRDFPPNPELRSAYFDYDDYNIISIDYNPLVRIPCYFHAVANLPVVAQCTAQLIDYIVNELQFPLKQIHIIGFSLGAQVAGMIGNFLKSGKIERITGLDPAKPLFILRNLDSKLDKSDANFVQIIHTDVLARGIVLPLGHVDFYVNGLMQPGCETDASPGNCNHERAVKYYAESVTSRNGFWGRKCDEFIDYVFGHCSSSTRALMGMHTHPSTRGIFYVETNKDSPYAKG